MESVTAALMRGTMFMDEHEHSEREVGELNVVAPSMELVGPIPACASYAVARPDPADLSVIGRVLRGDTNAYRALIERYQRRVAAIMWRFSRDRETHLELVQEVFVQAYESLSKYRGEAPFEHWIARIATRVGYRYWRRKQRALETVSLDESLELAEAARYTREPQMAGEALYSVLSALPPRDRLVLTLRYVEELSVREIAKLTGWSETMVKVQAWRARRKLRALFERADRTVGE